MACFWILPKNSCAHRRYIEPCPPGKKGLMVILSSRLKEGVIHTTLMDLKDHAPFDIVVASAIENKDKIKAIKKKE